MSEYFRVLKRIEQGQPERDVPTTARVVNREAQEPIAPTAQPRPLPTTLRVAAPRPETAAAFVTLFDSIRALGEKSPLRTLVFAGASSAESVRAVTVGLAAHIESLGLRVLLAELADIDGRPILRSRAPETVLHPGSGDPIPPDLGGKAAPTELTDWLEGAGNIADFVLIEGRPLAESIDSALLARACDGLVIVAQSEATLREALRMAAERAQKVGCRTLGLVVRSRQHPRPQWLRRLTSALGKTHPGVA